MQHRNEASLLKPVSGYVRRRGFRRQFMELPFFSYRIDLYGFSRKDSATVAVELKLHRWRRALRQAIVYQLCSDYVFIAMPEKNLASVDLELLRRHGVGLIGVANVERCRIMLHPERSREVREYYKSAYISHMLQENC